MDMTKCHSFCTTRTMPRHNSNTSGFLQKQPAKICTTLELPFNLDKAKISSGKGLKINIHIMYSKGQKTLWEKEKMLDTSIYFFVHNIFRKLLLQCCFW